MIPRRVEDGSARPDRRAIIDIGSNTVRLVIYAGPPRAPQIVLNEKVSAKLGRDLDRTGMLADKAMAAALAGLARFATLLRALGVEDVQTVATAASRDARNGAQFLDAVRALGLSPRLLSGEEEARASALGVIGAFPGAVGVVADLGGGSLELVRIEGESIAHGASLPFGSLRLAALRADGPREFALRADEALTRAGWDGVQGQPLYLVGGSWRAFSRYALYLETQAHASALDDPHGVELTPQAALRIADALVGTRPTGPLPGIASARLASLPDAAALLLQLIERLKPARLVFSSWGLREGLLYSALDPDARRQHPLVAGVGAFAARYGVNSDLAEAVLRWVAIVPGRGDGETEPLRKAATFLTLAAQRIEPNLRTDEALEWALRKRWIGLDNRGRALLAAAVLGNAGRTQTPPDVADLAPAADIRDAIAWGLAIRLCRKLCGGAMPALAASALTIERGVGARGKLVLRIAPAFASLRTDSVGRSLRLLGEWLGLASEIRVGEATLATA